jgi:hypothetical protein
MYVKLRREEQLNVYHGLQRQRRPLCQKLTVKHSNVDAYCVWTKR